MADCDLIFANAAVILSDKILRGHAVTCRKGKIAAIIPDTSLETGNARVVDVGGKYLAPGFIDLHIHGTHEFLVDNGPDDLAGLCRILPRYGVTSFLPTICPRPKGEDAAFVKSLASAPVQDGARVLGFHMEGPFLTLTGALSPETLGSADRERLEALIDAALPHKAIFSISPDFKGILDLIPLMARNDSPVFITHTRATVAQTVAAINAGAGHATHFYDVFPVPPETEPGVRPCGAVEAILADPRVSVDFILDGEHVDPVAIKMALACKGSDKVCLVTDANIGAGLPPGRHRFLGGVEVVFQRVGGPARLAGGTDKPGVLAGSGLTMDRALRNAMELLGIDLCLATRMTSTNPARVLKLADQLGRIEEGYHADFVVLDENLRVCETWIGAKCVYRKEESNT